MTRVMYSPVQDGFSVREPAVRDTELPATDDLSDVIHCFWELRTLGTLPEDFHYHALPDACVNLLFNLIDTEVAGVTALHTEAATLNLGTSFHYVGVQLFPGVWRGTGTGSLTGLSGHRIEASYRWCRLVGGWWVSISPTWCPCCLNTSAGAWHTATSERAPSQPASSRTETQSGR